MTRGIVTVAALMTASLVTTAYAQGPPLSLKATEHGWTSDYDQARIDAKKTNRPLMVVFRCVP